MSAVLLPSGVIRVPTISTLENGAVVHGTRDLTPEAPDYDAWLPHAVPEEESRHGDADDAELLARWRGAASA
ncbi:hypothetical protein [Nonomuraea roseola]|uniref:Uncharacterized protein n=1 Tax=Nonomuraea roseola TaxID=46179 RepID=A0ABV5QF91_9ACTN